MRPLEYTRSVLANGLVVLLNEDHSSPLVAVDVWYHIGAKDELPGRTGLAHLCEHLMGEGSPNLSTQQRVFIQSLGGTSSRWANTTEDITHYYYTLPRHQLEPALWLEADRMAAPLSRADAAHLGAVRDVIKQERVQGKENPVFGVADELTRAALFPGDHPYRIDPLGPTTDLDAASADDAKRFCAPYYVPNNAVISLSGDLSASNARMLIEKYFGGIPRGPAPPRRPNLTERTRGRDADWCSRIRARGRRCCDSRGPRWDSRTRTGCRSWRWGRCCRATESDGSTNCSSMTAGWRAA